MAENYDALRRDAARYRWLRERDLDTIQEGGVFAGMTPQNVVINGEDLDLHVDAGLAQHHGSEVGAFGNGAEVVTVLVQAYQNATGQMLTSEDLEWGHKAGVRDVAVRLGVYGRFCQALEETDKETPL